MRYKYTGTINLSVGKVTNVKVSGVVIWKSVATCLQVNKICESNKILAQKPSQVFFFFFFLTYLPTSVWLKAAGADVYIGVYNSAQCG